MSNIIRIDTIGELHSALGLEKPKHPLVSVIPIDEKIQDYEYGENTYVFGFYQIALKLGIKGEVHYGRNTYDFDDGSMVFTSPEQAMSFKVDELNMKEHYDGWVLVFHPDLIRRSQLGSEIAKYSYFTYEIHEALHLSEQERASLTELVDKIEQEYNQNIDRHTQKLIVNNIELILDYCVRYYDRQFYVRSNLNKDFVSRFENALREYFEQEKTLEHGLPKVKYFGEQLNMSSSYLSDLLKKETGSNAQQHIQTAIIEQVKTRLLNSDEQVSQIAYSLGFDYPQHLSKMFKTNIGMSPAEYRKKH